MRRGEVIPHDRKDQLSTSAALSTNADYHILGLGMACQGNRKYFYVVLKPSRGEKEPKTYVFRRTSYVWSMAARRPLRHLKEPSQMACVPQGLLYEGIRVFI